MTRKKIHGGSPSRIKFKLIIFGFIYFFIAAWPSGHAGEYSGDPENAIVMDSRHYSHVLGELRNYRIFLPGDYYDAGDKRYSVVYYFHGWSQRYFGSLRKNKTSDEPTDDERLAEMAARYDLIVVKTDGYNSNPEDPYNLRPYNIGPVHTHRQFPLYFPEIVTHIDANYRTIAKRENRAISGLSMGGFMSFWIAGKYPHLLAAAGSFCGSPEFQVGPRDFSVEYYHRDMYKNYEALKLRLHYGDRDFIRAYHRDINQYWLQVMDNYESQIYPGEHDVLGLDDMFKMFTEVFSKPIGKPRQWNHIDVYPEFSVWDYTVQSDRNVPGFTVLEDVDKEGFRVSVRRTLPVGETVPMVKLQVFTAPLYQTNADYLVNIVDLSKGEKMQKRITSDGEGRLRIPLNGGLQEVGILETAEAPNISIASVNIGTNTWASAGADIPISITLINKGGGKAGKVTAKLVPFGKASNIKRSTAKFGDIGPLDTLTAPAPFVIHVNSDTVRIQKFDLAISDEAGNQWIRSFTVNVKPKVAPALEYEIADGRTFTYARGGNDTITGMLGIGNGDGVPNPGESIVVLVKDSAQWQLTSLHTLHPSLDMKSAHTRFSDSWSSFDHVGGTFKYSMPVIASDTRPGTQIDLFAEYWLADYPDHYIKNRKVSITVSGKDQTPPQLAWKQISGDNIYQLRLFDGGRIAAVELCVWPEKEPDARLCFALNDEGISGDRAAGDAVFSAKLTVPSFGLYQAEIIARDSYGNENRLQIPESFILHEAELFP